jgi:hypothetical protein
MALREERLFFRWSQNARSESCRVGNLTWSGFSF